MANNKFIDKVLPNTGVLANKILLKLSLANPRLRCSITRLHIQIEMQCSNIQCLIEYFLILQPEYQYHWNLYPNAHHNHGNDLTKTPVLGTFRWKDIC